MHCLSCRHEMSGRFEMVRDPRWDAKTFWTETDSRCTGFNCLRLRWDSDVSMSRNRHHIPARFGLSSPALWLPASAPRHLLKLCASASVCGCLFFTQPWDQRFSGNSGDVMSSASISTDWRKTVISIHVLYCLMGRVGVIYIIDIYHWYISDTYPIFSTKISKISMHENIKNIKALK